MSKCSLKQWPTCESVCTPLLTAVSSNLGDSMMRCVPKFAQRTPHVSASLTCWREVSLDWSFKVKHRGPEGRAAPWWQVLVPYSGEVWFLSPRERIATITHNSLVPSPWRNEALDHGDLFGNVYFCSENIKCWLLYIKVFSKSVQEPVIPNIHLKEDTNFSSAEDFHLLKVGSTFSKKAFLHSPYLISFFCVSLKIYSIVIRLMGGDLGRYLCSWRRETAFWNISIGSQIGD